MNTSEFLGREPLLGVRPSLECPRDFVPLFLFRVFFCSVREWTALRVIPHSSSHGLVCSSHSVARVSDVAFRTWFFLRCGLRSSVTYARDRRGGKRAPFFVAPHPPWFFGRCARLRLFPRKPCSSFSALSARVQEFFSIGNRFGRSHARDHSTSTKGPRGPLCAVDCSEVGRP